MPTFYLFSLLLLLLSSRVYTQVAPEYPVSILHSSFNTFSFSQEIRGFEEHSVQVNSFIRKNTGLFSDVYQTKTSAGIKVKNSTLSLLAYNDRQSELIQKSRLYINGNTHISFSEHTRGFVGMSIGLVSKTLGNHQTELQGSAMVFDASARLGVYSKQHLLSFAILQIPQNSITPINFTVPLYRHYQTYYNYSSLSYNNWHIEGIAVANIYNEQKNEFIIGIQPVWKKKYKAGFEISNLQLANYFLDISVYDNQKVTISALLGYETSFSISKYISGSYNIINAGFVIQVL